MNKQAFLEGYMHKESRDASMLPYRPTAEAFLRNPDGTLAVKVIRTPSKEFIKSPGGGIDEGETPEAGLLRELTEETGITP